MSSWEKAYVLGRILPKTAVIPLLPLIMLIKMPMFKYAHDFNAGFVTKFMAKYYPIVCPEFQG